MFSWARIFYLRSPEKELYTASNINKVPAFKADELFPFSEEEMIEDPEEESSLQEEQEMTDLLSWIQPAQTATNPISKASQTA